MTTTRSRAAISNKWNEKMPIQRQLQNNVFGPEAAAVIAEAYEAVVKNLGVATTAAKEEVARAVIDIALNKKDFAADELAREATAELQSANGGRRRP